MGVICFVCLTHFVRTNSPLWLKHGLCNVSGYCHVFGIFLHFQTMFCEDEENKRHACRTLLYLQTNPQLPHGHGVFMSWHFAVKLLLGFVQQNFLTGRNWLWQHWEIKLPCSFLMEVMIWAWMFYSPLQCLLTVA